MKNVIITVFFLLLLLANAIAQSELPVQTTWIKTDAYGRKYNTSIPMERYRINSNGEIDGLYIKYSEDGKTIIERIIYVNGSKHGPAEENNSSGNYFNGMKEGEWISSHFWGESISIKNYSKGKLNGTWIVYSDETRSKILEYSEYYNGELHGKYSLYFDNGSVKEDGNYINGEKNGFWVEYSQDLVTNKNIFSEGHYINGNKDGEWSNYGKCYANFIGGSPLPSYTFEPNNSENPQHYGIFAGNQDKIGPKEGYIALFNNGRYVRDYNPIEEKRKQELANKIEKERIAEENRLKKIQKQQDSIRLAEEMKILEQERIQDSLYREEQKKAEKEKNEYFERLDSIRNIPLNEVERKFAGRWKAKYKTHINNTTNILIEEFNIDCDRTYTYRVYNMLYEYNEKGVWILKNNTLYKYIYEEDGKLSMRSESLVFDRISRKKMTRIASIKDHPPIRIKSKKVAN